eukprot:TRINITY_DN4976_c0_g2_i1.p1 TRINITY_DN4976_c0_g2~~TRINITY_DN4976_c0_g2_i1.p1  ORF type:complete len:414 (+),score=97.06 TRINITY_DN4976_c0_g2_i1:102-1343(+)
MKRLRQPDDPIADELGAPLADRLDGYADCAVNPDYVPLPSKQQRVPCYSVAGADSLRPPPMAVTVAKPPAGVAAAAAPQVPAPPMSRPGAAAAAPAAGRGGGIVVPIGGRGSKVGRGEGIPIPPGVTLGAPLPTSGRGGGRGGQTVLPAPLGRGAGLLPLPPVQPVQLAAPPPTVPAAPQGPKQLRHPGPGPGPTPGQLSPLQRAAAESAAKTPALDPKRPWLIGKEINYHWFLKENPTHALLDPYPDLRQLSQKMHEHRNYGGVRFVPPRGCTQFPRGWSLEVRRRHEGVIATHDIAGQFYVLLGTDKRKSDVQSNHSSISSVHMVWVHHPLQGGCLIMDLRSAHGTSVDGKKLPAQTMTRLEADQVVKFGICQDEWVLKKPPGDKLEIESESDSEMAEAPHGPSGTPDEEP